MAEKVTKDQIDAAEADFQVKVTAHAVAAVDYNGVVPDFIAKRRVLRDSYAAEVASQALVADLIARYEAEGVPPVPGDE